VEWAETSFSIIFLVIVLDAKTGHELTGGSADKSHCSTVPAQNAPDSGIGVRDHNLFVCCCYQNKLYSGINYLIN
jgi:hypothetical protein